MRLLLSAFLPLVLAIASPRPAPLVVKASPAASPCVAAAIPLFETTSGQAIALQTAAIGPTGSGAGADVVVAVREELTRVIEGGEAAPEVETDVASIPWVLVGAGATVPELRALERSDARVRVFGGVVGRHARQSLERLAPERVRSVRTAAGLRSLVADEVALVPLSLARPGPVSATQVPPLLVQAVAIDASRQLDAARAFVRFLAAGPGNEAFRACGRGSAQ
jgi:hypothetical protein